MLDFYHDLGMIVRHGNTVVLQAQWLIDVFKQLITIRPFNSLVRNNNLLATNQCTTEDDTLTCIKLANLYGRPYVSKFAKF